MDVSKLPEAPWDDGGPDKFTESEPWVHCLDGPEGLLATVECEFPFNRSHTAGHPGCEQAKAIVEFIALARNAFDVQMRRGWYATPTGTAGWIVCSDEADAAQDRRGFGIPNVIARHGGTQYLFPDPFTALVEADRWYREHVEAKKG